MRQALPSLLVLALFAGPVARAQTLSFVVADHALGMSDGLPAAQVLALHEDRAGAIWVGTTAGLARLGGAEVRVFGLESGLPRNFVYAVAEGRDGTLFAGTLGGIARFDGRRFRRESGPAGAERRVRAIVAGPNGDLWALIGRDTILKLEGQAWGSMALPEGLVADGVALDLDARGDPWLATRNQGLLHLALAAQGGLEVVERFGEPVFPGGAAEFVVRDGEGVAASGRGVVVRIRDGKLVSRLAFPHGAGLGHAALARSRDGRLYLGTAAGVAEVGSASISPLRSSRGLAGAPVVRLAADRAGNLWVGTQDRGVHVLFTGTGIAYMRVDGSDLRGIDCDPDGFCWISTERELYRIPATAGEDARPVRVRTEGIPAGPAFSFEDDGHGNLLLALEYGVGVLPRDSRTGASPVLRRDPRFDKIGAAFVPRLLRDRAGCIWVSSRNATWRLDPGARELTPFILRDRGSEPTAALALDRTDTLFVSDHEGGLWRLSPSPERRAERVSLPAPQPGPVEQIAAVPDGDVIVAFENGAWALLEAGTGRLRARAAGGSELDRLSVLSVAALGDGRYLAAHGGNRLSLVSLDPPRVLGPALVSSDLDDADFRYLSLRKRGAGGYFLTTLGAVARLAFLPAPAAPAPLRLADVRTENELPASGPDHPRLGPRPNAVDVFLSLAEPIAPRQVRYRWRLRGESERWSEWTSDPRVRISNLGAGEFVLEAEARDRYGRRAPEPLALPISALPLYWETLPFRAALALAVLALGYLALRVRVRSIVRDRQRLEAAVAERSAELARANRELQEASLTDPLTGLRNRRFFEAIIADEVGRAQRAHSVREDEPAPANPDLIFYLVDLDHFKEVNDTYGHAVGDRVLVEAARRIGSVVRKAEIVIRWGGEEFLVVSREARRAEGERLARRIVDSVGSQPFDLGEGRALVRTASVGWAPFPWRERAPGAEGHESALRLADQALYAAKSGGRNRAVGFLAGDGDEPRRVSSQGPAAAPAPPRRD